MKKRTCDFCNKEILPKTDYIKLQLQKHGGEKHNLKEQIGIGDLCIECFNQKKGVQDE